jgi:hypothetical protein
MKDLKAVESKDLNEIRVNEPGKLKFPIIITNDNKDKVLAQIKREKIEWNLNQQVPGINDHFKRHPDSKVKLYMVNGKLNARIKFSGERPLDEIRINPPVNVDAKSLVELWLKVHNDIGEISINYMDEFDSQINDLFKRFFSKPENNKFEGYITLEQAQMLPYNKQREAYAQLKGIEQQVSKLLTNQMNEIYEKKLILKRAGILF